MLGKLTKHEFIACGRNIFPAYIALVIASVVGKFFIWLSSKKTFIDSVPYTFYKIVKSLSSIITFLYIVLIISVLIGTVIFLIVRFYKNYFTDEGYLMLTLPVKSYQLVLSKLFSSIIWSVFSGAVVFGSLSLIMRTEDTIRAYHEFTDAFADMCKRIATEMDISYGLLITEIIFFILIAVITQYLIFYFSITFGSTHTNKNKVLGSIVTYIVVSFIIQGITLILMYVLSSVIPDSIAALEENVGKALQSTIITTGIMNIIYSLAFFLGTGHLIKKKTNLD